VSLAAVAAIEVSAEAADWTYFASDVATYDGDPAFAYAGSDDFTYNED
jgi:hypothetical protein